ncbi:MAG: N-acetyl-gamma-glutamyl-phosphate reductase [Armatimonadetes bacterium]|nr:N-acetyl-gamma-glutamyl-phosphate reductase [Armatimonadota bacterium]
MIKVGIIGASGYAGAELIRYLLAHPEVEITYLASSTFEGKPISEAFPSFLGQNLPLCESYNLDTAAKKADFFFQAQGNGAGMKIVPELLARGKKIIDVPADFRLKDVETYKKYYGMEHIAIDALAEAVYGISELHPKEIAAARIVANPGCYATGAILALAPLVGSDFVCVQSMIVDSKSGVSGAGRSKLSAAGLFCEVNEGCKAYDVATHRHTPEIEQELCVISGKDVRLNFTPHLAPMNRGILTTAYASAAQGKTVPTSAEMIARYREFYARQPFVMVLDEGKQPCTKDVFGTNFCHIGLVSDSRTNRVIVTCAIDNMGKGAAGQAIQNMNLMCGFDQAAGLMSPAIYP